MKCELISVGTELLLGNILNTNAQYLGQELEKLGIDVYYQITVGDNSARLADVIRTSLHRSDLIITTGGLGPTDDDLTKETVAEVFGLSLIKDSHSMERIQSSFARNGVKMPACNLKQAYMPEGCIVLDNEHGTAPACILEKDGKIVVVLPGPPKEMKPLFETHVVPFLRAKCDWMMKSKILRIVGVGESTVQEKLQEIFDTQTNPTIAPYAKETGVELRITAKTLSEKEADRIIEELCIRVRRILGDYILSENGESLEEVVVNGLAKRGLTISLAESCTGGLATAQLINVPGSSAVVIDSIVSYTNEAKMKFLGVKKETLETFTAVSEETAREMAEGIRSISGTSLGVGITGVAGPDGGTPARPVGLVYIAVADEKNTLVKRLQIFGDRSRVRRVAAMRAIDLIRRAYL